MSVILSFVQQQVCAHIRHLAGTHLVRAKLETSPEMSPDFLQFLYVSSVCLMDADTSGARASLKTQKYGQKALYLFPSPIRQKYSPVVPREVR